ncbi:hypothetical protein TSAR_000647 [Trichomalopsis sarcophagae]|uniref:DDE Tnp4 domain-containing protein n=1 Tax=Trichomalopsis sarcophagae TaxID=543379 RepID=A0A232F1U7_9HYME|nr:hypothetical protein TSAR_000647 [Trichomalopsis sarcophagae]
MKKIFLLTLYVKVIPIPIEAEAEQDIHHDWNCDTVFAKSTEFDESDICEKATDVDNAPVNTRSASVEFGDKSVQANSVTVRNAFYDTVKNLATILQSTIMRVSKEEILRNMPKCFNNYRSTTCVLDCTEIKIQKPSCLKCCIKFYSYYKGDLTVKFMTKVPPGGILIYKRVKLIRPPFLRNQTQLSKQEAIENRDIASARVHIERMNQRIKLFQILNNKIPWYFLNYVDDIFTLCCGLANLGSPTIRQQILKYNK